MKYLDIKLIPKLIGYFIPILTIFSYCKQGFYYSLFGINIGDYISIDELLTPFFNDLIAFFIFIVIPCGIFFYFISKQADKFAKEDPQLIWHLEVRKKLKKIKRIAILFNVLFGIYLILCRNQDILFQRSFLVYILSNILFLVLFIYSELNIKLESNNGHKYSIYVDIGTFIFVSLVMMVFLAGSNGIRQKSQITNKVLIEFNGDNIVCGTNYSYIGRTKDYTFVYEKRYKQTIVLNNASIKRVVFIN